MATTMVPELSARPDVLPSDRLLANGMAILGVPSFYQTIATGVVLLLAVGVSQIKRITIRRRAR